MKERSTKLEPFLILTVNPVNDLPEKTDNLANLASGSNDTPYVINRDDLLQGFSDIDGDTLSIKPNSIN